MTTPDHINQLEPHQVFVFGSNLAGRHGKGAAKAAVRFGAKYGVGEGPSGQTYAIPTKDERIRTLSLNRIWSAVCRFLRYAKEHPDQQFLVTPIGCGLAGYKPTDIAPMFADAPSNVILPKPFQP